MTNYRDILKLSLVVLAMASVGCSQVDFSHDDEKSLLSTSGTGNGDASGTLSQGGTPGTGGTGTTGTGGTGTTGTGGTGTTGTGGTGTTGTGTTGTGGTGTTLSIPGVHFVGPPCKINTACQAQFVLDQAVGAAFTFHWRTNDTAYTLAPPSPGVIYGKPLVHYVPTSGDVTFQPGETTKTVFVQNINPDPTVAIVIQVIMSQCYYNNTIYNCGALFH